MRRRIIEIERALCDGCGLCTTACAEGALALDKENKAVLVKEIYCDGLGACLDVCPTGALRIVDREGEGYDAEAALQHVLATRGKEAAKHVHGSGGGEGKAVPGASELRQWPIQLHLVSPHAPYFKGSDLLIAADCTAFALGSFHSELLSGKKLIIACPKLDETEAYADKLAELIKHNGLRSLTVAIMTVPCCSGLYRIVERAIELSRVKIGVQKKVISVDGKPAT